MAVAANICIAWPSTAASIPAGWTRETSLDARYILGAGTGADTDLSTDRGATTHTHTSPSHTPTQNSHTHNFNNTAGDASATIVAGAGASSSSADTHGHDDTASNATTATNNSIAITVDAATNDLAYTEVIWIKSDGSPVALPSGCYAFFESDTLPSGWTRVKGDRYLKGAAAASNPALDGGSNTHSHTSPAHTHTQNSHSHTGTSAGGNAATFGKGTGTNTPSTVGHTHAVTLASTTATNQSVTTTIDAANHEPPFKKLNVIQTGADSFPTNIIALWLSTNATIPADWTRYTGMDGKWLKDANANGESGITTGGTSQHNHSAADCQPTQNSHTHSTSSSIATTASTAADGGNTLAADGHNHASWNTSSDTATNSAVAVTIDNCAVDAALPKHRTVIYVQFTGSTPPTPTRGGVWTSYDLGLFGVGDPRNEVPPEVGKRIAQGDLRFVPR